MMIRQAIEKDAESLLPLIEQLGYQLTQKDLLDNIIHHHTSGYDLFVAEAHDKLMGFISLHFYRYLHLKDSLGRITALCVDEAHRNFGVGALLLAYAEDHLKAQGCTLIELTSGSQREDAHRFYERHGYMEKRKRFIKKV